MHKDKNIIWPLQRSFPTEKPPITPNIKLPTTAALMPDFLMISSVVNFTIRIFFFDLIKRFDGSFDPHKPN